jgi:hypothetical protein
VGSGDSCVRQGDALHWYNRRGGPSQRP